LKRLALTESNILATMRDTYSAAAWAGRGQYLFGEEQSQMSSSQSGGAVSGWLRWRAAGETRDGGASGYDWLDPRPGKEGVFQERYAAARQLFAGSGTLFQRRAAASQSVSRQGPSAFRVRCCFRTRRPVQRQRKQRHPKKDARLRGLQKVCGCRGAGR